MPWQQHFACRNTSAVGSISWLPGFPHPRCHCSVHNKIRCLRVPCLTRSGSYDLSRQRSSKPRIQVSSVLRVPA